MLRRGLVGALALLGTAVVAVALALAWAHVAVRREQAPLPAASELGFFGNDGPVRAAWINTASQPMPRSAVLDSAFDRFPRKHYVMSYPAFVLQWADGRLLLIDAGMRRQSALEFGRPIEWLGGAGPIRPLTSVAEGLGPAASAVRGVIFTHLHVDHVDGIVDVCKRAGHEIEAFMTQAQAERPNYTTRPGLKLLDEAGCVRRRMLPETTRRPVPGFPGVFVIAAGGHTPGSEIVVAHVNDGERARVLVFTGDIANSIDGINQDIPKPFLYRWLVVPEAGARQRELRGYLRALRDESGFTLLVSHDQAQLEASGLKPW